MQKTLDEKIARILKDSGVSDFILADAKDADMGFGIAAPGVQDNSSDGIARFHSIDTYRQNMREIVQQGLVDIMLMSVSTSEILTIEERLFDESAVTPAIRANDTSDIWLGESGDYKNQPSLPFQTTTLDHAQCGKSFCSPEERSLGVDLGLYSITFNNDAILDREALQEYAVFRIEAEEAEFRHFLEVFVPNAPGSRAPQDTGRFVNDSIARTLAGVTRSGRPLFLKMPYFGPRYMEDLVQYDASLIVGVLGGPAGTTHDAFQLLWEAKKYGARAALFGRKINQSEHQLSFVKILRAIADGQIEPEEAVRAYHGELQQREITPKRDLETDLQFTPAN